MLLLFVMVVVFRHTNASQLLIYSSKAQGPCPCLCHLSGGFYDGDTFVARGVADYGLSEVWVDWAIEGEGWMILLLAMLLLFVMIYAEL